MKMRSVIITLSCVFGVTLIAGSICAAVAKDEIVGLFNGQLRTAGGKAGGGLSGPQKRSAWWALKKSRFLPMPANSM